MKNTQKQALGLAFVLLFSVTGQIFAETEAKEANKKDATKVEAQAPKKEEVKKDAKEEVKKDAKEEAKKEDAKKEEAKEEAFKDIKGNWAEKLIAESKGYGIANESKEFQPEKAITRGEFAVGLVQGLNLGLGQRQSKDFKDVKDTDWYAADINIATAHEIIFGRGDGNFDPNATITRQEAFSMLARALDKQKADLAVLDQFKDNKEIDSWAKEACALMVEKKVVKGRPEGFAPKAEISRAEAVQLIHQLAGLK
ncbi:Endo-1,4-beta-xylanase A precursor [Urinicoccus massiliensis]|uniref:Endo-1,4-beta-xylanase A n=1 Tax=Urinicoccus massiliensis TaxID=1723382 RepID=A0A8H2QRC0_9FIRM|nr:S-layer homology domain-containing protein [Urinicoccus massiliensis]VFB15701.1 Endo-1,4-beta-xylanase A precursor [Urinicoccus massiliensis]